MAELSDVLTASQLDFVCDELGINTNFLDHVVVECCNLEGEQDGSVIAGEVRHDLDESMEEEKEMSVEIFEDIMMGWRGLDETVEMALSDVMCLSEGTPPSPSLYSKMCAMDFSLLEDIPPPPPLYSELCGMDFSLLGSVCQAPLDSSSGDKMDANDSLKGKGNNMAADCDIDFVIHSLMEDVGEEDSEMGIDWGAPINLDDLPDF